MSYRTMQPGNFYVASSETVLPLNDQAALYANRLLRSFDCSGKVTEQSDASHLSWCRAGLDIITGETDQKGLLSPVPLTTAADGAMMALRSIASAGLRLPINGALLLGERSRLIGLTRQGRICPGGFCRLLDTQDGRIALNMARDDDWGLMPAWLEAGVSDWAGVQKTLRNKATREIVTRGQDLGLALAQDKVREMPKSWFGLKSFSKANNSHAPLVVDLSALWAGPLAGSLLGFMGAKVIKVESSNRTDGARRGNKEFYRLLNAGKKSAAFDFQNHDDLANLKALIDTADIVIEASRPRALQQLGIIAEDFIAGKPGKVWLGLSAYGRTGVGANRIGFGDDIGVSAGLSSVMEQTYGRPVFVGDAIADPLSGLHGAFAAMTAWQKGGGVLIDLPMVDVVRYAMGDFSNGIEDQIKKDAALYEMRAVPRSAPQVGTDTNEILHSLC